MKITVKEYILPLDAFVITLDILDRPMCVKSETVAKVFENDPNCDTEQPETFINAEKVLTKEEARDLANFIEASHAPTDVVH